MVTTPALGDAALRTSIALDATAATPIVHNVPGLKVSRVDEAGWADDYELYRFRVIPGASVPIVHNVPGLAVNEIDEAGWAETFHIDSLPGGPDGPKSYIDNLHHWLALDETETGGLIGWHRDGYGVLGPLPARAWRVAVRGAEGAREVWLSDGELQWRVSTPDEGPDCHSAVLSSIRLTYFSDDGATLTPREVLLTGTADTLAAGVTKIRHTAAVNQSNTVGSANAAVVTDNPISAGRVVMFNGGIRVFGSKHDQYPDQNRAVPFENLLSLVDAYEQTNGTSGETPMGQMATDFVASLASDEAMLISNHAIGSISYASWKSGTQPFNNLVAAAKRARIICGLLGLTYQFDAVISVGGEGDNTDTAAQYRAKMEEFQPDLTEAISGVTGGADEVLLYYVQMGNNSHYSVDPNVAQGQLEAAVNSGGNIICAGPGYPYPTMPDGVHKTAQGQADTGATIARFRARAEAAEDALPLYITSAVRTVDEIVLTFHLPPDATTLQFLTTLVSDPGDRGVSWHQTGGTARTIVSVAITDDDEITVGLSGDPGSPSAQKIGIGWLYTPGAAGGPTTGGRSCICTNGPVPDYACQQLIDVT